jgi:hypothetical protein
MLASEVSNVFHILLSAAKNGTMDTSASVNIPFHVIFPGTG